MKPLINTHTHIFSYKDVPPYIARGFVPYPFYLFTHFTVIFWIFKKYKDVKHLYYNLRKSKRKIVGILKSNFFSYFFMTFLGLWIGINAIYFVLDGLNAIPNQTWTDKLIKWLIHYKLILTTLPSVLKYVIVLLGIIASKTIKTIIFKISKAIVKPLGYLPNKKTLQFANRYIKIAAIANYKSQATAYNKLYKMYPPNSKFVVLTMDMTYMCLTRPRNYYLQLDEIVTIMARKNENYKNIIPFLFVDPRRIDEDSNFFQWRLDNGQVIIEDCLVKKYLINGPFRGIKIYPALGYYAFDERLLPLWLYCAQNYIPITTHCTVGTIFYRKRMKKDWFNHPIFKDKSGKTLDISTDSNMELQKNFTHPLNYLVLVEPHFLKKLLATYSKKSQQLFGYVSEDKSLKRDLNNLKINIAHYGGTEQWMKHMDSDRTEYAQEIMETPDFGIRLFSEQSNPKIIKDHKPADIWQKADWYSIISSLMLQYDGIYADISYILHSKNIRPLLNLSLQNSKLADKILFGTDYYVVRNHKSEKELFAEMIECFTEKQMNLMGRENPNRFLKTKSEKNRLI